MMEEEASNNLGNGQSSPSETTHLISKDSLAPPHMGENNGGNAYDSEENGEPTWRRICREFAILLKGAIPVILAYALQNSLQTLSVVVVGRESRNDLATAAFAYMFAMATAWLIAMGGTTALDTLCSSTFTGSKDPHDLGILLQRAFIILGLFYIPVAILWALSEPLFLALGQDAQISRDSAQFLRCLIPGGLGYIYFEAMKKYLQAQGRRPSFITKLG